MPDFSFCKKPEKAFPEYVEDHGNRVKIDPDFRTVIRCIGILGNNQIPDGHKQAMIRSLFFDGAWVSDPAWLFFEFVRKGMNTEDSGKRVMDFFQDQDAIYASFLQQYAMDITAIDKLHWYKFRALLAGVGDQTPLGYRIHIRSLDTRKYDAKDRATLERLKRFYALDQAPMNLEEEALHKAVDAAMQQGRDPAEELRALREYYKQQDGEEDGA